MKCKICNRDAIENGYCVFHFEAYKNILAKFIVWKEASGVDWGEYLVAIQKNSLTGEWAKEVIKDLIAGENRNV